MGKFSQMPRRSNRALTLGGLGGKFLRPRRKLWRVQQQLNLVAQISLASLY